MPIQLGTGQTAFDPRLAGVGSPQPTKGGRMAASIVLIKAFLYRGSSEEYTNTYHFDGGAPATQAAWLILDNAVRAEEKKILGPTQSIVRTLGYTAPDTP